MLINIHHKNETWKVWGDENNVCFVTYRGVAIVCATFPKITSVGDKGLHLAILNHTLQKTLTEEDSIDSLISYFLLTNNFFMSYIFRIDFKFTLNQLPCAIFRFYLQKKLDKNILNIFSRN